MQERMHTDTHDCCHWQQCLTVYAASNTEASLVALCHRCCPIIFLFECFQLPFLHIVQRYSVHRHTQQAVLAHTHTHTIQSINFHSIIRWIVMICPIELVKVDTIEPVQLIVTVPQSVWQSVRICRNYSWNLYIFRGKFLLENGKMGRTKSINNENSTPTPRHRDTETHTSHSTPGKKRFFVALRNMCVHCNRCAMWQCRGQHNKMRWKTLFEGKKQIIKLKQFSIELIANFSVQLIIWTVNRIHTQKYTQQTVEQLLFFMWTIVKYLTCLMIHAICRQRRWQ